MRFRHNLTGKNRGKRALSFLLLCLLVSMLPNSIGMDAKADDAARQKTDRSDKKAG